jgi:hypothetical protein
MAFDASYPDPASSATDRDNADNNINLQSFALIPQPYAQCTRRQWQFLPSSHLPGGRHSFPLPTPGSQSQTGNAPGWRIRHEVFAPPWQSLRVDAVSTTPSPTYLSIQNDAVFAPKTLEPTAMASYQAPWPMGPDHQLLEWNNSLASSAPYQTFMPAAPLFPNIPVQLESPPVTMAPGMLRAEGTASASYLGSPPYLPVGQTWTTNLGIEESIADTSWSPTTLQTAQRQQEFSGETIPRPTEATCSFSTNFHKRSSTCPSPAVAGCDDLGSPVPTSSKITHVSKRRNAKRSSGQVCTVSSPRRTAF